MNVNSKDLPFRRNCDCDCNQKGSGTEMIIFEMCHFSGLCIKKRVFEAQILINLKWYCLYGFNAWTVVRAVQDARAAFDFWVCMSVFVGLSK